MKTSPIEPAVIDFGPDPAGSDSSVAVAAPPPRSLLYGDVYHPRIGAFEQARHVFLRGTGLPARWSGQADFVILETGFGLGNNFLATWQAWRDDPRRCERLHYVSIERHPPRRDDLARAHASSFGAAPSTAAWRAASASGSLAELLLQAWPPLTANLHALDFEQGRVRLLLAFGDVAALLPGLRVEADAFFLDGFAPAKNPAMWQPRVLQALGRKAAAGATLATWTVAAEVRAGLTAAGFEVHRSDGIGGKREITVGHWAPRFEQRRLPPDKVTSSQAPSHAVVVGAGIAGAAAARSLADLGFEVTVFDRHAAPATEASGNTAGLFHGTVHRVDGLHARLFRSAALQAERSYTEALGSGVVAGMCSGLLRLDSRRSVDAARKDAATDTATEVAREQSAIADGAADRGGQPADYVQWLNAADASARAGVALPAPAWFYPGGGWIAPGAWVRWALGHPRVRFVGGVDVGSLARCADGWLLHDAAGRVLAQAALVVLAEGACASRLAADCGQTAWPVDRTRGQVTQWRHSGGTPLRLPVAGDGYALPLGPLALSPSSSRLPSSLSPSGVLCGATQQAEETCDGVMDASPRLTDERHNLERLRRLTGLTPPAGAVLQGRVGWRLHSADRLPIAGALPLQHLLPAESAQLRWLPRERGLFVLTALGGRGLTLAPLLGRLVAAMARGTPWPLEQDLVDAMDPARWLLRAARKSLSTAPSISPSSAPPSGQQEAAQVPVG